MQYLKSNDMSEYKKMLQGAKGERLKFLIDRTDKYIEGISGLLEKRRGVEDGSEGGEKGYYERAHGRKEEVRHSQEMGIFYEAMASIVA